MLKKEIAESLDQQSPKASLVEKIRNLSSSFSDDELTTYHIYKSHFPLFSASGGLGIGRGGAGKDWRRLGLKTAKLCIRGLLQAIGFLVFFPHV